MALRSTLRSFGKFRPVVAPIRLSQRCCFASKSAAVQEDDSESADSVVSGKPQSEHYIRTDPGLMPRCKIAPEYSQDVQDAAGRLWKEDPTLTAQQVRDALTAQGHELPVTFKNEGQDFPTEIFYTEDELAPEQSSAISFWGKPALFGSLAAIIIGKEMMVMNEEIFLMFTVVTAASAYYIAGGDMYRTNASLWGQSKHDWRWEKMLQEKRKLEEVIAAREATLGLASVTQKFFDYKQNLRERLFQARTHRKHQAAAEQILAQFQSIAAKESAAGHGEKREIAEGATQFALSEFKSNPKAKEQVILEGLALMDGSAQGKQQTDQIGALFGQFLTKYEQDQKPLREAAAKEAAQKSVSPSEFKKIVEQTRAAQLAVYQ